MRVKLIPSILLTVLFVVPVFGQVRATTDDGQTVLLKLDGTWELLETGETVGNDLEESDPPGVYRWEDDGNQSDLILRNGLEVFIIEAGGISVSLSFMKYTWDFLSKNHVVSLMVRNNSGSRIDIDPVAVELVDIEKSENVQQLTALSVAERNDYAINLDLIELSGLDLTAEELTYMNADQWLIESSLKPNTLMPGDETLGLVWFRDDGNNFLVRVPLEDYVFEFDWAVR